jgi:hypothetical protein
MSRTISSTITNGVTLASGDDPVTVLGTAYVSGTIGISGPLGTSWTITNQGTVAGVRYGVSLAQGGTITNTIGASITGGMGVYVGSPGLTTAASVSNAGTIGGIPDSGGFGIYLKTVGQVSNDATGLIEGNSGIKIYGSNAVVSNLGTIAGTYPSSGYGIYLRNSGTVTNGAGGPSTATIQGYYGVAFKSVAAGATLPGTLANYGTILGTGSETSSVNVSGGGSLINGGSGATGALIQGGRWGVYFGLGATVTNYATIQATYYSAAASGVFFNGGPAILNNLGTAADISGYVGVTAAYGTVTNAGTIASTQAGGTAVDFIGAGDRLIVDPTAVFIGIAAAGPGGPNVLELAGSSVGTLSGIGTNFTGFGTIAVDAGANWTLAGSNSVSGPEPIYIGTGGNLDIAGALSGPAAFALDGGTLQIAGALNPNTSFALSGGTADMLQLDAVTGITLANAITGFGPDDGIVLPDVTFAAGGVVTYGGGTLTAPLAGGGTFTFSDFTAQGTPVFQLGAHTLTEAPCFLPGTHILTERGEVPVEKLAIGDTIVTLDGGTRPLTWIGHGRALATRGRRSAATPVIVTKGALADNVPHHDLRITKGHALYFDGTLIPVEFLVNHRSILWDDRAQEVTVYHLELDAHDVLLANGVPAESYRDDGNRWLFQNANTGWDQPAKPPCAPVLTGGALVDAVWQRILDRAGPRMGVPITDDPDLRLMADGSRLDARERTNGAYVFDLPGRLKDLRIVSRTAVPQELGFARDPRCLGVALRRLAIRQGTQFRIIRADDARLLRGFHGFEANSGVIWTDGDAVLPIDLFAGTTGPLEIVLTVAATTHYIDEGVRARTA